MRAKTAIWLCDLALGEREKIESDARNAQSLARLATCAEIGS